MGYNNYREHSLRCYNSREDIVISSLVDDGVDDDILLIL
jgi:hypothetical protein